MSIIMYYLFLTPCAIEMLGGKKQPCGSVCIVVVQHVTNEENFSKFGAEKNTSEYTRGEAGQKETSMAPESCTAF